MSENRDSSALRSSDTVEAGIETTAAISVEENVTEETPVNVDETAQIVKDGKVVFTRNSLNAFPSQLLKHKNVMEIDLFENNIQRIPRDIGCLTSLVRLNLGRNPIFGRTPSDKMGVPTALASLPHLRSLSLTECGLRYVPPTVWECTRLRQLDLSRNRLGVLPADVGRLVQLRLLDVRSTGIVSIPSEIVFCRRLNEILLWGNSLQSLPDTIAYLPRLRRLAVDFRCFCVPLFVDDFMEELLRAGSFESDHLPAVVFEMPALETLDLDKTKLNRLPNNCSCPLRELFVSGNYFRSFPSMIFDLNRLLILDISTNLLQEIPSDIGMLTQLHVLWADNNQINVVAPEIANLVSLEDLSLAGNRLLQLPKQIGDLRSLRRLNLSGNPLASLPASVGKLQQLETLDLTDCHLESLPRSISRLTSLCPPHSYSLLRKNGLWLRGNPLLDPPPFIWNTTKRQCIYDYLEHGRQLSYTSDCPRRKIIVVGNPNCGKSSIVNRLVGQTAESICMSSSLVRFVQWTTEAQSTFLFVDFAGDREFCRASVLWPLFFDDSALYLVVYDHNSEDRVSNIGRWLELITKFCPRAVVQIVGTQEDLSQTSSLETDTLDDSLEQDLSMHTSESHKVRRDVMLVSSTPTIENLSHLTARLEQLSLDEASQSRDANNGTVSWSKLKEFCMTLRRCCSRDGVWMEWEEASRVAGECDVSIDDLPSCLRRLHSTGDIYWCQPGDVSQSLIFSRPRRLVEIIDATFLRDFERFFDFEKNQQLLRSVGGFASEKMFELECAAFFEKGVASRRLLMCLWSCLSVDAPNLVPIIGILEKLQLACRECSQGDNSNSYSFSVVFPLISILFQALRL